MQDRYWAFKEQLDTRTRPEDLPALFHPFNVTPELTQASLAQKPGKESVTPPPPLNPAFLAPPSTVETPSQQGLKRKRRLIQCVNYLDDHKTHGKQLRKRRHKSSNLTSTPWAKKMRINLSFPYKSLCILLFL